MFDAYDAQDVIPGLIVFMGDFTSTLGVKEGDPSFGEKTIVLWCKKKEVVPNTCTTPHTFYENPFISFVGLQHI